jgi:drug/metabolite transporter (DMT)-like permease
VRGGGAPGGVGHVVLAWLLFALHDASVKLLVADLSAWQVLAARSLVVLPICLLAMDRRPPRPGGGAALAARPRILGLLGLNGAVYALAWVAYYSAARDLQLAELETVYYASPVITTALAVLLLRERVPPIRWAALGIGFAGVVLACGPTSAGRGLSVGLALIAAALWALSVVLMRRLTASVPTATQMLANNSVFLALCAASSPWWWQAPAGGGELALLALVGLLGCAAQYLLCEGLRRAPASVAAPLEYSGLLWAFALGFLIWGDVPATGVFAGAGLIVLSGLLILALEARAAKAASPPEPAPARAAELASPATAAVCSQA